MNAEPMSLAQNRGVCFAVPSYGHSVSLGFLRSWTETIGLLKDRQIPSSSMHLGGDPFVAKARNRLATDFLQQCPSDTDLFFLDDDVDWPAAKVIEFLERPEPVLAGIYPQKKEGTDFPVTLAADTSKGELIERDGLIRALLIPTGFLRIKRWVLEKLIEPPTRVFKDTMIDGSHKEFYGIFESGIGPQEDSTAPFWWGEDYIFSRKCQTLGIDMWIDPDITMGHVGRKRWENSVAANISIYRDKAKAHAEKNPVKQQRNNLMSALKAVAQ